MTLDRVFILDGQVKKWFLYYLTDGIYPNWSIFLKPVHNTLTPKERTMTKAQESQRKDVERFFGVLQGRFKILRHEFYEWSDSGIVDVLHVCVIIHNILITCSKNGELQNEEDESGNCLTSDGIIEEFLGEARTAEQSCSERTEPVCSSEWLQELMGVEDSIRDDTAHKNLKKALQNHIWNIKGDVL